MDAQEHWYRYEARDLGAVDDFGDLFPSHGVELLLMKFKVTRHTPKGVWLDTGQFVRKNSKRRYAYPTQEQALANFVARKKSQIRILEGHLARAKQALTLAYPLKGSLDGLQPVGELSQKYESVL